MSNYDDISREVRLIRTYSVPKVAGGKRWRWDVQPYRRMNGPHSANGPLQYIGGRSGYTFTRIGALVQINRALNWIEGWR